MRFLLGIFMYTMIYYLPIYFIVVRNSSATSSGLHLLPFVLSASVAAIAFGALVNILNTYKSPMWFATMLVTVGIGLTTTIASDTTNGRLIGYLIIFGFGIGITMSGIMVAIQIDVKQSLIAVATTVANFFWSIGGAIGLPVMSSVFINVLTDKLDHLSARYPDQSDTIHMARNNNAVVWNSDLPNDVRNGLIGGLCRISSSFISHFGPYLWTRLYPISVSKG